MKKVLLMAAVLFVSAPAIQAVAMPAQATTNTQASDEDGWYFYTYVSKVKKGVALLHGKFEVQRNSNGDMRICIKGTWYYVSYSGNDKYPYRAGEYIFDM